MTGAEFRRRRKAIDASQGAIALRAGASDTTLRKLEKGVHVSEKFSLALWSALEAAEAEAANPPVTPAPATTDDLRAVLDELRAFRRLYEDDREQTERLAEQIEVLAARIGEQQ